MEVNKVRYARGLPGMAWHADLGNRAFESASKCELTGPSMGAASASIVGYDRSFEQAVDRWGREVRCGENPSVTTDTLACRLALVVSVA